jgi:hypothetical protein
VGLNFIENKFVYIKVRREVAEEMKEHFNDLINLGLCCSEGKKYNRKIIKAIDTALKNNGNI